MKLIENQDEVKVTFSATTIRFTADQVAACGLPHRGAFVEYDERLRLDGYSAWLDKRPGFGQGIDKLISLADALVYRLH